MPPATPNSVISGTCILDKPPGGWGHKSFPGEDTRTGSGRMCRSFLKGEAVLRRAPQAEGTVRADRGPGAAWWVQRSMSISARQGREGGGRSWDELDLE